MPKVIILGAKGRFGRAATNAFLDAGWQVAALARNWPDTVDPRVTRITGDVTDQQVLNAAVVGSDVIINAINPPYPDWPVALPKITKAVIEAARVSGATVMIPGNVYNYGADAPEALTEDTAWAPTSRKGVLRVEMENAYRAAAVPTIVLRAGDYIDTEASGNWFDSHIAVKSRKGRTMYPGPRDAVHAWAYLPDVGRAAVVLAENRQRFAPFEEFNFTGYGITGAALVKAIADVTGKPQKVSGLPWAAVWLMGLWNPLMREVHEMRYLWRVPHVMRGTKFEAAFPSFRTTPLNEAIRAALP